MREFLMRLCGLSLGLFSSAVLAQGFELDLSEPEIPAEFRPSIAVVGVTSGEATEDAIVTARARLLEAELLKATTGNAAFGKVMTPQQVADELGPKAADARKCIDFACLDAFARRLKVDRLISGLVTKSGPASLLTVHGFDNVLPEVIEGLVESAERAEKAKIGGFAGIQGKSQAQKDKDFVRSAIPVFFEVLDKIKISNVKITVDSAEQTSITMMNKAQVGVGSFDTIVPRGSYDIVVTAAGYLPYETKVVVEPQQIVPVKVLLVAKEIQKVAVVVPVVTGTPVFERPGLYIAVAGLVATGVGIGLGLSAKGVEARARPDANGVVPISRTAAKGAQTNAMLANVLVGAGAAVTVGGAVWFILTPGVSSTKKKEEAPVDTGGGFGMMVGYRGSF
jgi:hypothetical protein